MATALHIVKKFFPDVNQVRDADEPIDIEVTKQDNNSSTVRNHKGCAMAVACKRKLDADGVIVSVGTAYVIKGKKAIRYKLPEAASREVISYDRHGGFAPGEYRLNAPDRTQKLGQERGSNTHSGKGKKIARAHHTTGIRTVLGSGLT